MGSQPDFDSQPLFDTERKYVKVCAQRDDGFIEFEFAVGDPMLCVELILPSIAFHEFCLANEVIVLYAATNGYADVVPVDHIRDWETGLLKFIETGYPEIAKDITANNRITPETESTLKGAIEAYLTSWTK